MLFAPHHARESLSLDVAEVIRHRQRADSVIEFISLLSALLNDVVEFLFIKVRLVSLRKSESNN